MLLLVLDMPNVYFLNVLFLPFLGLVIWNCHILFFVHFGSLLIGVLLALLHLDNVGSRQLVVNLVSFFVQVLEYLNYLLLFFLIRIRVI